VEGRRRVFISCASSELGGVREELRQYLARANCDVKVQEDFPQSALDTIAKLDELIASCSAVIHLVGASNGAVAEKRAVDEYLASVPQFLDREPGLRQALGDLNGLSYTQWEAYLALHHRVPLFVYAAQGATLEPNQELHLARLRLAGRHAEPFSEEQDLLGKLIGDLHQILTPARASRADPTGLVGRGSSAVIERLAQLVDFLVSPVRFYRTRFAVGSTFGDALAFAATMTLVAFAVSVALPTSRDKMDVTAIAWAGPGTVVLWLFYAVFMHGFVWLVGGRGGRGRTLAAYLYAVAALQPMFVLTLSAVQLFVPGAVGWRELSSSLGGSMEGLLIASGHMLSGTAVAYYRAATGLVVLVYFAIGLHVAHRLSWWRCALAQAVSVVFFVIGGFIIYSVSALFGLELPLRLVVGT
jgi:hypothetical protein